MNRLLSILILTLSYVVSAAPSYAETPHYLVAQIEVTDQKKYFSKYAPNVFPLLNKAGAKVLVASQQFEQLEGKWAGNLVVVIRFPSEAAAKSWYKSAEYQKVRPLRLHAASSNNLMFVPEFTPKN